MSLWCVVLGHHNVRHIRVIQRGLGISLNWFTRKQSRRMRGEITHGIGAFYQVVSLIYVIMSTVRTGVSRTDCKKRENLESSSFFISELLGALVSRITLDSKKAALGSVPRTLTVGACYALLMHVDAPPSSRQRVRHAARQDRDRFQVQRSLSSTSLQAGCS